MSSTFSSLQRSKIIEKMTKDTYDLLIIGGGITGAGIALDAALRGMKVALLEMQDFSQGTSSRSTKLIHGGLRYLKQFDFKLVKEVAKERAIVYQNSLHITKPEWMLLPIYQGGTFGKFSTAIGLTIYDYLARVKTEERRRILSRDEVLQIEPLLKKDGLRGGGLYVEYKTDDSRLTIEVLKSAVKKGVHAVNYAKVEELLSGENHQVTGVVFKDKLTNNKYQVYAQIIVNATGPWVDQFRAPKGTGKFLRQTKGVHLVFDQSTLPLKQAIYFDIPDGRMIFAIPHQNKTYVGTTDTFYDGDLTRPIMTSEDRDYLLSAIRFMFPESKVSIEDIESSWAGVRPLIYEKGKAPSEISRKDEIWVDHTGLISIAGGKLTGYRKMAENVVNLVAKKLKQVRNLAFNHCQTEYYPISGGLFTREREMEKFIEEKVNQFVKSGYNEEEIRPLVNKYGTNIDEVMKYVNHDFPGDNRFTKIEYAQLLYSIYHEMTLKPTDFFIRRTSALYFNIDWVRKTKEIVLNLMQQEFNWTIEEKQHFQEELEHELLNCVIPSDHS